MNMKGIVGQIYIFTFGSLTYVCRITMKSHPLLICEVGFLSHCSNTASEESNRSASESGSQSDSERGRSRPSESNSTSESESRSESESESKQASAVVKDKPIRKKDKLADVKKVLRCQPPSDEASCSSTSLKWDSAGPIVRLH